MRPLRHGGGIQDYISNFSFLRPPFNSNVATNPRKRTISKIAFSLKNNLLSKSSFFSLGKKLYRISEKNWLYPSPSSDAPTEAKNCRMRPASILRMLFSVRQTTCEIQFNNGDKMEGRIYWR